MDNLHGWTFTGFDVIISVCHDNCKVKCIVNDLTIECKFIYQPATPRPPPADHQHKSRKLFATYFLKYLLSFIYSGQLLNPDCGAGLGVLFECDVIH